MTATKFRYQGQCLCGTIQYEVAEFASRMAHCHCSMCRKFHGAAFATYGQVLADNFNWITGETELAAYRAYNGSVRKFCRHCGSSLTFDSGQSDGNVLEIALGTLDTAIPEKPDAHIFVGSQASWFTIADELPQHRAARDDKSTD